MCLTNCLICIRLQSVYYTRQRTMSLFKTAQKIHFFVPCSCTYRQMYKYFGHATWERNVAVKRLLQNLRRNIRELQQRPRQRQRERQKSNRFTLAKQQLSTCITLVLYLSLPPLRIYNVKVSKFTFCRGREHKTTTFFFFSWTLIRLTK